LEVRETRVPLVLELEPCVDRARSSELRRRLAAPCVVAAASRAFALP
jgi:hypothetical protein